MFILQRLQQVAQYIGEAVVRTFSPHPDFYPEIGTQAFPGDFSGKYDYWPEAWICRISCRIETLS